MNSTSAVSLETQVRDAHEAVEALSQAGYRA
jgi:hypothetical protein